MGAGRFGTLLFLLFVAACIYFGIPIGETYWQYVQFRDEVQQQALVAPSVSDATIRKRLEGKADELGLPAEAKAITIDRKVGERIIISVSYEVPIQLPGTVKIWRFNVRAEQGL